MSAEIYLTKVHLVSKQKSVVMFFALCRSPAMSFLLYLTGIFDVQFTRSFFSSNIDLCFNYIVKYYFNI